MASHYLISREGIIHQLVSEDHVAYHAGNSTMPDGRKDPNQFSIGIEMIYTKDDSPNDAQYNALIALVDNINERYEIPWGNIVTHHQISPNREADDPANFSWLNLASNI